MSNLTFEETYTQKFKEAEDGLARSITDSVTYPLLRVKPCTNCRGNKWRTVVRNAKWMCRYCGIIRVIKQDV